MATVEVSNINRVWAYIVVDQLVKNGVQMFFTCPGMRNAPFLWAIEKHPKANYLTGIDERAHSYCALGYAKETGKTAVLVCTSGSALANFAPAVAEAHKSLTPIMVISADRPPELNWGDDNQTLDQVKAYGSWSRSTKDWGIPAISSSPLNALAMMVSNLISKSYYPCPGPVHLNAPMRGPLDATQMDMPNEITSQFNLLINNPIAKSKGVKFNTLIDDHDSKIINKIINEYAERPNDVLISIGELSYFTNKDDIIQFCSKTPWPIYADISSGLKYSFSLESGGVPTFDHEEVLNYYSKNPPGLVIHLGRRSVSKFYYRWLSKLENTTVIQVCNHFDKMDPSFNTTYSIDMDPNDFCKQFMLKDNHHNKSNKFIWESFVNNKSKVIDNFLTQNNQQNGMAFPEISKTVIEKSLSSSRLYIGNSTSIRSFDSFANVSKTYNLKVHVNRGTSGIEGFVSSALGTYHANPNNPLTLVLGDLSLIHDFNSLLSLKEYSLTYKINAPFVIIIVNNFKGGIFNLLPIGKEVDFNHLLTTPHQMKFSTICEGIGLNVLSVNTKDQLIKAYNGAQKDSKISVIECLVDDEYNQQLYNKLKTIKR